MSLTDDDTKGKPGRPRLIETDEFRAAVAAEVKAQVEKLTASLVAARQAAGTTADRSDIDIIRTLAMSIAELNDQGTNRKRVAPEILARRAAARDRMGELLMQARAKKLKPDYRLIAQVQLIDPKTGPRLLQPFRVGADKKAIPVEIYWYGVPNEAMRPLNDAAKEIYRAFMESIGGSSETPQGKFAPDTRPMSLTQGGLIVKGEMAGQRRTVSNFGDPVADEISKIDIEIEQAEAAIEAESLIEEKPLNDPTRKFVPVLGTVHPPARQSSAPVK